MIFFQRIKAKLPLLRNLKQLFHIILGALLYFSYAFLRKMDLYKAGGEFYKAAQSEENSWAKVIAINFFESPLGIIMRDYYFFKANIKKERLSTGVLDDYSDENLSGYGAVEYDKGGESLDQQQRGLILPLLENSLLENQGKLTTVVEIGCGNGDALAYLADKYHETSTAGM
jgi:hypothetical protein